MRLETPVLRRAALALLGGNLDRVKTEWSSKSGDHSLLTIGGVQLCGSNSLIELFFCVDSLVSTSFR